MSAGVTDRQQPAASSKQQSRVEAKLRARLEELQVHAAWLRVCGTAGD